MNTNQSWKVAGALAAVSLIAGCGGDLSSGSPPKNQAAADIAVPTITAGSAFSFDLGMVLNGKYYVTDRNNKSVDVVDVATLALSQIKGTGANVFAGCSPTANCVGANNGKSGPDGINAIAGTTQIYVGDVDFVRVIDRSSNTVTGSIRVGNVGFRADEGCYDPDHHIYMISIPDADTPAAAFISTTSQAVLTTVRWIDTDGNPAGGNEQCQYDSATQSFIVNNDATLANPHGELEVIPVASIQGQPAGSTVNVLTLANLKRFSLGNCDPTGLDLGPGTDAIVECRQGDKGAALTTLIVNRTNGAILATVPVGGGDQVAYDAPRNRYLVAASRWHASGINDQGGGCSAANPCTPVLAVIDAASRSLVSTVATGNNAHSVAVDPVSGQAFLPYSSATNPSGCATCAANGFVNGGISVFFP
ncbi:MAG: hypothetical protein ACXWG9_10170 [Usitatibacter sp.]